jgi:hypothetical protein
MFRCESADHRKYIDIVDFATTHDIVGKPMTLETEILSPHEMLWLDDTTVAIAEEAASLEYSVNIVSVNNEAVRLVQQIGRKGQGPDDVAGVVGNMQKDTCDLLPGIWLTDMSSMKFFPYSADVRKWKGRSSKTKKLSSKIIPCTNSFIINNSESVGISMSIDNQIFRLSFDSDTLVGYDFYPLSPNPYDHLSSKTIFPAGIAIKPDKSKFVLSYNFFKSIGIIDINNLSESLFLRFNDTPFPKFNGNNIDIEAFEQLPLQYVGIYTTDKYIYALYAGKTVEELIHRTGGMSIHIFKWDGTAHSSLHVNGIINSFCVDEKNGFIYGIDPTGEDNSVFYRFTIPENIL